MNGFSFSFKEVCGLSSGMVDITLCSLVEMPKCDALTICWVSPPHPFFKNIMMATCSCCSFYVVILTLVKSEK